MARPTKAELLEAVEALRQAKRIADAAEGTKAKQSADTIDTMKRANTKTVSYEVEGTAVKAALVQGSRVVYDEAGLRKALGAKTYAKAVTPKLDTKKLEALIASGEVDATIVAQHSDVLDNQPYVKFTEKEK